MPYDGGDLYVKVEVYINGAYIEVTSRARGGRAASGVEIGIGRGAGAIQAESSVCQLTLGNADAFATEGNPESPWYPYFGRGCGIRVSLSGILPSDSVRFEGEIDTITAVYPGGADSSVRITATGILAGQLGLGADPLRSAMHRTMSGVSPDGYVPAFCWSLEDEAGATEFASSLPGGIGIPVPGNVTLASDSAMVGSAPLPTFEAGAVLASPVISYTATGQWIFQFTHRADVFPVAEVVYARIILAPGGTLAYIDVSLGPGIAGSPIQVYARGYTSAGAAHGTLFTSDLLTVGGDAEGEPTLITVAYAGGTGAAQLSVGVATASASSPISSVSTIDNASAFAGYQLRAGLACTFGYPTLYTDPTIVLSSSDFNRAAMSGWTGELAHDRIQRLCDEEGIPVTITGTSEQAMGPQTIDTLVNLLIECEAVDGGLLVDGLAGGGLAYRCGSSLTNQTAALAVLRGALDVDVAPIWDNRHVTNDVTVSRPGGSSSRQTDEAHVTRTRRRIKTSPPANVASDSQLADQAGWYLARGTTPGPRYNAVGINLRNSDGARLADAVLALTCGDRFTAAAAALPPQHPPGGIDSLVIGWQENLDATAWTFSPACVDYAPYFVAVLDDDDLGKLDTAGCVMQAGASDSATSFTVATTVLPRWTTDAGEMPIPVLVSGQVNNVTAVADVSPSFVAVGAVAHASNASVTPTMPAGVQAGDLLLVLAAIRNSGAGTVDTPSGYTVLLTSGNMTLLGKVHTGTESAPTVTFAGGVANADTSAQMAAFRGVGITVHASTAQLNASAQDVAYPLLDISRANCLVLYLGWKADDWTSVAAIAGATEIGEPDTTTGDDQGMVWDYVLQTTAARIAAGSFTVTGGASAVSRGAVIALATDVQTMTVTRAVNDVAKAIPIGSQVNVYRPARLAL